MRGLEEPMIYQSAEQAFLSRGASNIYVLIGCTHFSLLRRTNCKRRYWSNHNFQYPWNRVLSIFSSDAFQLYGISMFSKHFAERTKWLMAVPQHLVWAVVLCSVSNLAQVMFAIAEEIQALSQKISFSLASMCTNIAFNAGFLHHHFTWTWIPHGHEAFNRFVPVL